MAARKKTASSAAKAAAAPAVAPLSPLASALLEAQVQFIAARLDGAALTVWIEELVDSGLDVAGRLKLGEAVGVEAVKASACAYAAELDLGGGLPELVAEIAVDVHGHPIHADTRFVDVLPDAQFRAMLDQGLELRDLRERLVRGVLGSPIYSEFVSDLLYHGIRGYLAENAVTRHIPGARSALALGKALLDKASPRLEASIEEGLRRYIGQSVGGVTRRSADFLLKTLDEDALREASLDAWSRLKDLPLSSLRDDVSADELESLFVTGYEYWRVLRKTVYYRVLIEAGIDRFFVKYGKRRLAELLDDLGITREIMIEEAQRYAPKAIQVLQRKKLLLPLLRQHLEPFYRSPEATALLAQIPPR